MKRLVLALDISTTITGYSVMDENLQLTISGQFNIEDRHLSDIRYATMITKEVFKLVNEYDITDLIIEDVFFGKNVGNLKTWCRVHGAVGMSWAVKHNEPHFMMASEARKLLGIHGHATKIEIQLNVATTYSIGKMSICNAYKEKLDDLIEKKNCKKYSKNAFDYRIKKISKAFEEETGISEHIADSNVLARAFFQKEIVNV